MSEEVEYKAITVTLGGESVHLPVPATTTLSDVAEMIHEALLQRLD
jgi:hypothetical protein